MSHCVKVDPFFVLLLLLVVDNSGRKMEVRRVLLVVLVGVLGIVGGMEFEKVRRERASIQYGYSPIEGEALFLDFDEVCSGVVCMIALIPFKKILENKTNLLCRSLSSFDQDLYMSDDLYCLPLSEDLPQATCLPCVYSDPGLFSLPLQVETTLQANPLSIFFFFFFFFPHPPHFSPSLSH